MPTNRTSGAKSARGARHKRYTDEFRATAVAAAIAAGYPSIKGALSRVAREQGIAHQILRDWILATNNPPPQKLLQEKRKNLRDLFLDEVYEAAGILPQKRGSATYSQLATAMGIFFDKVRLLDNLPTEIFGASDDLTAIVTMFRESGVEFSAGVRDWRAKLEARKAAQAVSNG